MRCAWRARRVVAAAAVFARFVPTPPAGALEELRIDFKGVLAARGSVWRRQRGGVRAPDIDEGPLPGSHGARWTPPRPGRFIELILREVSTPDASAAATFWPHTFWRNCLQCCSTRRRSREPRPPSKATTGELRHLKPLLGPGAAATAACYAAQQPVCKRRLFGGAAVPKTVAATPIACRDGVRALPPRPRGC